jgi:SNF2 family DNA or RNA helicase
LYCLHCLLQSRDVVVYRLVTCGTAEEKIYRKQVFKGGLSKAGMEEGVQLRWVGVAALLVLCTICCH